MEKEIVNPDRLELERNQDYYVLVSKGGAVMMY